MFCLAPRAYCNQKTALSATGMFTGEEIVVREPQYEPSAIGEDAVASEPISIIAERGAEGEGWDNTLITDAGSGAGLVHGPWGSDVTEVRLTVTIPQRVTHCTVSWRSWIIDSRDGSEVDEVRIDGVQVWNATVNRFCEDGWQQGPATFPQNWGENDDICFQDVTVGVPCMHTMDVVFASGLDQELEDEAWAFSNFTVVANQSQSMPEFGEMESAAGIHVSFPTTVARYVRHWTSRSTVDVAAHMSEIAVYGFPRTVTSMDEIFAISQVGSNVTVTRIDDRAGVGWTTDLQIKCCQTDAAQCSLCNAGYETNAGNRVGGSSCTACPAGQYTSGPGERCRSCDPGLVPDVEVSNILMPDMMPLQSGHEDCLEDDCMGALWAGVLQDAVGELEVQITASESIRRDVTDYLSFEVDGMEIVRTYNVNSTTFRFSWPGPGHELRIVDNSSHTEQDRRMTIVSIVALSSLVQAGMSPDQAATRCTACLPGRFSHGSALCHECDAGSVTNTLSRPGAVNCTACNAGYYSSYPTLECEQCGPGYRTLTSTTVPGDNIILGATNCTACPAGRTSSNSTASCVTTPRITINGPSRSGICAPIHLDAVLLGSYFQEGSVVSAKWDWNGTDFHVGETLRAARGDQVVLPLFRANESNAQYLFTVVATVMVDGHLLQAYGEILITKMLTDIPEVTIDGPQSLTIMRSQSAVLFASGILPNCGLDNIDGATLTFLWTVEGNATVQLDEISTHSSTLYLPRNTITSNAPVMFKVTVCTSVGICNFDTILVTAASESLRVHILGGALRTVGTESGFSLDAVTNLDVDHTAVSATQFSWVCNRDNETVVSQQSSHSESSHCRSSHCRTFHVAAGTLPPSEYTCSVSASYGEQTDQAEVRIRVEIGEPPIVSIHRRDESTMQIKFNPAQKLALLGSAHISSNDGICDECEMRWSAEVCHSPCAGSDAWAAVDMSPEGFLLTSPSSTNLVVNNGQLSPGAYYRFTLDVALPGLQFGPTGSSSLDLLTNAPPISGRTTIYPTSGMAVQDTFTLMTSGWRDDDLPFLYRFSTAVDGQSYNLLSDFSSRTMIEATLSAGFNNLTEIKVEAKDSLGAIGSAHATAYVLPYAPVIAPGSTLAAVATDLLNASSSIGDMQRVGQIILSLASSLNSESLGTNSEDAMSTREVLVDAVVNMGEALTPAAVTRASQTLNAVTANSAELSEVATDKSIEFATKISTEFKTSLSSDDVANLASTVSSVLLSSTRLFASQFETNTSTASATSVARRRDDKGRERGQQLSRCVAALASVVAGDQVAGEAQTFGTATFSMSIKKDSPGQLSNAVIGGGSVIVPEGAFSAENAAVSGTVVNWRGAGPLFFAATQSPEGSILGAELRSSVLTVSFSGEAGEELNVTGLSEPFVLNLSAPHANNTNESAACAHWNTATGAWVSDGVLVARHDDVITCKFYHLTDFGGFIGPMPTTNTVSNPLDFARWADNVTGAIMSGCILFCAVATCCWSLKDYRQHSKTVVGDRNHFDDRTTEFVHTKLHATATSHSFIFREWLLLRWGCQLCTTAAPHKGDPYLRSQRILVFVNALLVSLVCSILFFDVPGDDPECCTCMLDAWTNASICGLNASTWTQGNKSCSELGVKIGDQHCDDGEEADNGPLAAVFCALLSLPIVATMHLSFRWVRRPLERFIMVKVLQHEQRNIVVVGAIDLAQADADSMSDPYCKMFFNGHLVGRTKVIVGNNSPTWNAVFNLVDAIGPIPNSGASSQLNGIPSHTHTASAIYSVSATSDELVLRS